MLPSKRILTGVTERMCSEVAEELDIGNCVIALFVSAHHSRLSYIQFLQRRAYRMTA